MCEQLHLIWKTSFAGFTHWVLSSKVTAKKLMPFRYIFIKISIIVACSITSVWHYLFPQTWVKIADGIHKDDSCPDIYERIVFTLSQTQDRDAVWKFAEWTLQRNQEVFVFSMLWPLGVKVVPNSYWTLPCTSTKRFIITAFRQFLMDTCPVLKDRCADLQQASSRRSNANSGCPGSFDQVSTGVDFVSWVLNIRFEQWGECSSKPYSKPSDIISLLNLLKADTWS